MYDAMQTRLNDGLKFTVRLIVFYSTSNRSFKRQLSF